MGMSNLFEETISEALTDVAGTKYKAKDTIVVLRILKQGSKKICYIIDNDIYVPLRIYPEYPMTCLQTLLYFQYSLFPYMIAINSAFKVFDRYWKSNCSEITRSFKQRVVNHFFATIHLSSKIIHVYLGRRGL